MNKWLSLVLSVALLVCISAIPAFADRMDTLVINPDGRIIIEEGTSSNITSFEGDISFIPRTGYVSILEHRGVLGLKFDGVTDDGIISYDDATDTFNWGGATLGTLTLPAGAITMTVLTVTDAGGITVDAGDIDVTLGDIDVAAGDVNATLGALTAGTTVTGGTGVIATTGGIDIAAGDLDITLGVINVDGAAGGIVVDQGNIAATLGSVAAGTTVTAGTNVIATADLSVGEALITNIATLTCTTPDDLGLDAVATMVTSASAADIINIAGGTAGQIVIISYVAEGAGGDNLVITPTAFGAGANITLDEVGDFCVLIWDGAAWQIVAHNGVLA